jgi:hypothetical protein
MAMTKRFSAHPAQAFIFYLGLICLAFSCLALSGCSSGKGPEPTIPDTAISQIGVYLARGSLFQTPEFEQYRVNGRTLYAECGIVRGGRPQARDRHIIRLDEQEWTSLQAAAMGVPEFFEKRSYQWEAPGTSLGFSDPGQATVRLSGTTAADSNSPTPEENIGSAWEIKTSLDEVASQSKTSPLRRLVVGIRTITRENLDAGPEGTRGLCDNPTFYGLE